MNELFIRSVFYFILCVLLSNVIFKTVNTWLVKDIVVEAAESANKRVVVLAFSTDNTSL